MMNKWYGYLHEDDNVIFLGEWHGGCELALLFAKRAAAKVRTKGGCIMVTRDKKHAPTVEDREIVLNYFELGAHRLAMTKSATLYHVAKKLKRTAAYGAVGRKYLKEHFGETE